MRGAVCRLDPVAVSWQNICPKWVRYDCHSGLGCEKAIDTNLDLTGVSKLSFVVKNLSPEPSITSLWLNLICNKYVSISDLYDTRSMKTSAKSQVELF